MKLSLLGRPFTRLSVAAPLALALAGCSDPFVAFGDVPTTQGDTGGSTPNAGSAAQATGAQPSAGSGATGAGGTSAGGTSAGGTGAGASDAGGSSVVIESGGSGGVPGAAGDTGTGGEPSQPPPRVLELIDDVEGAFPHLPPKSGRNGGWYTTHDSSYGELTPANAMPLQPARGDSHFAAEFSGSGYTSWGAQLGVSLMSPTDGYDASAYCGVRFLAKGAGSGWTLLVSDRNSVPQGGVCDPDAGDGDTACYHFSGKSFEVGADWQEVVIRFQDLKILLEPSNPRALAAGAIYDIIFNVHNAGSDFQLLVDDLSFIKGTAAGCQ